MKWIFAQNAMQNIMQTKSYYQASSNLGRGKSVKSVTNPISKDNPLNKNPNLDLVLEEARRSLDAERNRFQHLDYKAEIILAISIIIIPILMGIIQEINLLLFSLILPFTITLILVFYILYLKEFPLIGDSELFLKLGKNYDKQELTTTFFVSNIGCLEILTKTNEKKVKLIQNSYVFLFLGLIYLILILLLEFLCLISVFG